MFSKLAAESPPIIDPGNVPFFWVDGLESYEIKGGRVFSRFFMVKPIVQRAVDFSPFRPRVAQICLEMGCSLETQLKMRGHVTDAISNLTRLAPDNSQN